jgi:hypothetical protein
VISPYIPHPTLDAWVAEKAPALTYPTGEPIRIGDHVDFGVDPSEIGIDSVEGPWPGTVVGVRVASSGVLVDTFCNSIETYHPDELRLLGRPDPKDYRKRYDLVGPYNSRWYVRDKLAGGSRTAYVTREGAEAARGALQAKWDAERPKEEIA